MDIGGFLLHLIFIGVFAGGSFMAGYFYATKKLQNKKPSNQTTT